MILAATGMQREARIIARAGLVPVISGGDAARLRRLLMAQAARARAIVSIGIAGALSPELRVGDVVVGDGGGAPEQPLPDTLASLARHPGLVPGSTNQQAVANRDPATRPAFNTQARRPVGRWTPEQVRGDEAEMGWVDRLLIALPGARRGIACGSDAMVITAAAKARLYEKSRTSPVIPAKAGTSPPSGVEEQQRDPRFRWDDEKGGGGGQIPFIIDMESHIAAQVAREHGLPFAFIRVISDRADQDLPPAVTCGLKPDGSMAILPVLSALLRNPAQLPALIRTARDTERAMRSLLAACDVLARSGIGLPDRG